MHNISIFLQDLILPGKQTLNLAGTLKDPVNELRVRYEDGLVLEEDYMLKKEEKDIEDKEFCRDMAWAF